MRDPFGIPVAAGSTLYCASGRSLIFGRINGFPLLGVDAANGPTDP